MQNAEIIAVSETHGPDIPSAAGYRRNRPVPRTGNRHQICVAGKNSPYDMAGKPCAKPPDNREIPAFICILCNAVPYQLPALFPPFLSASVCKLLCRTSDPQERKNSSFYEIYLVQKPPFLFRKIKKRTGFPPVRHDVAACIFRIFEHFLSSHIYLGSCTSSHIFFNRLPSILADL